MNIHAGAPLSAARRMALEGRGAIGDMAQAAAESLHDVGDTARHAASRYYRQGRGALGRSARDVEHYVEDQPVRSALMALGIGCIVAALLIRR